MARGGSLVESRSDLERYSAGRRCVYGCLIIGRAKRNYFIDRGENIGKTKVIKVRLLARY